MKIEELLFEASLALGIELTTEQITKFLNYKELLLSWNEKMNLTAITEENDIILKHFIDSLSLFEIIDKTKINKIIDVGTGAGFPGIPLKIVNPLTHVTLLDSLNKRLNFLNAVIESLNLNNIKTIHKRAEDAGKDKLYREKYDYAVSRAVANLSLLAEYCMPFVKIGGKFISMKGPNIKDELDEANKTIKLVGGEISEVKIINIPFSDIKHSLIIISKLSATPIKFPRKPTKSPKVLRN